jgi:hypothetical protein
VDSERWNNLKLQDSSSDGDEGDEVVIHDQSSSFLVVDMEKLSAHGSNRKQTFEFPDSQMKEN